MVTTRKTYLRYIACILGLQVMTPLLLLLALVIVHRKQHEALTRNQPLTTLTVNEQIGKTLRTGDDLQWGGKWYDIKSVKQCNSHWEVTALKDDDESIIRQVTDNCSPDSSYTATGKILPFIFLYHEQPAGWFMLPCSPHIRHHRMYFVSILAAPYGTVHSPPPECVA